jgi:hypothetical protein
MSSILPRRGSQLVSTSPLDPPLSLKRPVSRLFFFPSPMLTTYRKHRDLASDRWAWLQTRGKAGFQKETYPIDAMTWGTVSTKNATTWIHMDDEGFATTTQLLTGKKYWVAFYRDPSLQARDSRGDMGGISFVPPHPVVENHDLLGWLAAEAVELCPRNIL